MIDSLSAMLSKTSKATRLNVQNEEKASVYNYTWPFFISVL